MATQSERDALADVLGVLPADALLEWAEANLCTVRLAEPRWTAAGYTGAVLAAVNLSAPGRPDMKCIVKVCPPGVTIGETTRHHEAKAASSPDFFARHLVEQPFPAYPTADGGRLMFQDIATTTFGVRTLAGVPDAELPAACDAVIRTMLREWAPQSIRSVPMTAVEYLRGELGDALGSDGSLRRWTTALGLYDPGPAWIAVEGDAAVALPNPVLMVAGRFGDLGRFDVSVGASHGDLHVDNVLIPDEQDQLRPAEFRLVDLSTFRPDASLSRDAAMLMLSVIARSVGGLRPDEYDALVSLVLRPWTKPARLSALLTNTIGAIHAGGYETLKSIRHGDWRAQYLLSIQAEALRFTCFDNLPDAGRWWYFRLAAEAGAEFLRLRRLYRPEAGVQVHRPIAWPSVTAAVVPSTVAPAPEARLEPADLDTLVALLGEVPPGVLQHAFHETVESPLGDHQPNWGDLGAVVRKVETTGHVEQQAIPAGLVYADRVAHAVGGLVSRGLHRWLRPWSERHGVAWSAFRAGVCQVSENAAAQIQPNAGQAVQHVRKLEPVLTGGVATSDDFSGEKSDSPGAVVNARTELVLSAASEKPRTPTRRLILGPSLPAKNPNFTGREQLLTQLAETLSSGNQAAVVPQALHGLGGVGKTQLAIEYVYRHTDRYDLIWWIPSDDVAQIRLALTELAERLGLQTAADVRQTISLLFESLAATVPDRRWLLVYDNVNARAELDGLLPPAGMGDVIITSRNTSEFATEGSSIEVDVFAREESIELLQRHGQTISAQEADLLADRLGDLPLALEQAAIWNAQTKMPVREYLELFDENLGDFMSEGQPAAYPHTMFAIVRLAVHQLREEAPGAAELLESFAYFGAEPVAVSMLRRGRNAALSDALKETLRDQIKMNRAIRKVSAYGLVKVTDADGQRLQVHRLVQRVLREQLVPERKQQARLNVQQLLAAANLGEPDVLENWRAHAEIGPHVLAADLIDSELRDARYVVLDQIRYLYARGDYDASRQLGDRAYTAWSDPGDVFGPDDEITLIAGRHLANAYRLIGDTARARDLDLYIFNRLRSDTARFGPRHEHTLYTANNVSYDLRIVGDFNDARRHDEENVRLHDETFGPEDNSTLRAKINLAVNLRFLGLIEDAYEIDAEVYQTRVRLSGDNNVATLWARSAVARDLLDLGRYAEALTIQRRAYTTLLDLLPPRHHQILLAARTAGIALRRTGAYADARDSARENYHDHRARFGDDHEHTLSAALTYANSLTACSEHQQARGLMQTTVAGYRRLFGPVHPLSIAASIDLAIVVRRVQGVDAEVRRLHEANLADARRALGDEHPYALAAAVGLANALAAAGDSGAARDLSVPTHAASVRVRGATHPETLMAAVNAAIDLQSTGETAAGSALLDEARTQLRVILGPGHPLLPEIGGGARTECDIEPPPV